MKKEIPILILYLVVTTILCLGIHLIIKKKMWKPVNYLTIMIIGVIYILIVYQLRAITICFSSTLEGLGNSNTVFKLIDNTVDDTNLINSTTYGRNMKSNDFANDNHNGTCKGNELYELKLLVTASKQQLLDAKNTYEALESIYTNIKSASQNEEAILNELKTQMEKLQADLIV